MKTKYFFLAGLATMMFASCADDAFVGDNSPNAQDVADNGAIKFGFNLPNRTRAGEFVGATAAEKLGGMFVVEGTKGSEQTESPSTTVVFDNYLVGYTANTAGETKSNTHNWEYVGKQTGITSRMTGETWNALHDGGTDAKVQSIKYWDYSTDQYDFIAWSTGTCEAIATGDAASGKVKVTRINKGTTLASDGFTLTAASAADLLQCYYTDINTVLKANYGQPVTLTFRNMAAKVRVALYETVPGYSVKNVRFYTSDANPTAPEDLAYDKETAATLFTMGGDKLPQSGAVTVMYPHIGTTHRDAPSGQTKDYNKASVTVTPGSATATTQEFGAFSNLAAAELNETAGNIYLGRNLPAASFAGVKADDYYTAVIPNTNGKPLTLRVNYTLVSTDGSNEEIKVYGAKAVVPSTYTVWQPNYAYTYIFKISDNTNGWTSTTNTDPKGLFPITFDAVVTNFVDANAEQTTVTTVATPSITTYQQGHDHAAKDEYSKSQTAGVSTDVKDVYVQVMNNSGATPSLVADLNTAGKSLLFLVSKDNASEAEVMDALQNRTNTWEATDPIGRNGITLTKDATHLSNTETQIVNGVDDQPITKIAGVDISAGQVAKIDIDQLTANKTYAYVYCTTIPSADEKVYHVAADATNELSVKDKYYDVDPSTIVAETSDDDKAKAGKVYFVKNVDANGDFVSWTFKQTKVGDSVIGLFEAPIPGSKASTYTAGHFYFDVYNKNNGAYAVKVIKVVG
ncbi:hypothetical protein [Prevotella sp. E13-27]|uniref:hypothetical protein n=1 Tax=Prevotella sp. E13-27 TaxID=2938122 RepID=UPI00200A8515|nr:hypothetical protein [Prevotella sp. E13-27]MCK8623450.1 hypothetical protein [Prevotella sp. E13-27]